MSPGVVLPSHGTSWHFTCPHAIINFANWTLVVLVIATLLSQRLVVGVDARCMECMKIVTRAEDDNLACLLLVRHYHILLKFYALVDTLRR